MGKRTSSPGARKGRPDELTAAQEIFVQELIKEKSQRQAYYIAFPGSIKWKEKTVDEKACLLFMQSKIKARYNFLISEISDKVAAEFIVNRSDVLRELANVAYANGSDYSRVESITKEIMDEEGRPTGKFRTYQAVIIEDTENLTKEKRAAIAGIEETQSGAIKVKTYDKVKALELLGKHLELFTDKNKNDTTINGDLTIKVELTDD